MYRILVVDDEPQMLRALRILLTACRYDVVFAGDGHEALDAVTRHVPDLVVLDLGLPDMDGLEVITALRGGIKAPILVLSGRSDSEDKIEALDAGADDYVIKPFSVEEFTARIRALLRRADDQRTAELQVVLGDHCVDIIAKTVKRTPEAPPTAPETVHLTKTEWAVLEVLVRNPGRLVPSKQLLKEVWGPNYETEVGYLRFYMAKLRRKLEPNPGRPRQLVTEAGMGYRFQP